MGASFTRGARTTANQAAALRGTTRLRYAATALAASGGASSECRGPSPVEVDESFGSGLCPGADRAALPAEAVAASLGCGNPTAAAERGSHVGCVAGALSSAEHREHLAAAGLTDVGTTPTHAVADGTHSAIIRATLPARAGDR
ncbi:hypothetical protein CNX65_17360 [Actinosynnema pretiosum]|uniref:Uncharacterized protein n=1 Tax=Actinosynnema pretiosum TaxID=42197 RepID=A0A290ZGU4_9PSEU|nr:hypothetical protein CNX65_17360 [Actinosynnema pretiosum]